MNVALYCLLCVSRVSPRGADADVWPDTTTAAFRVLLSNNLSRSAEWLTPTSADHISTTLTPSPRSQQPQCGIGIVTAACRRHNLSFRRRPDTNFLKLISTIFRTEDLNWKHVYKMIWLLSKNIYTHTVCCILLFSPKIYIFYSFQSFVASETLG